MNVLRILALTFPLISVLYYSIFTAPIAAFIPMLTSGGIINNYIFIAENNIFSSEFDILSLTFSA